MLTTKGVDQSNAALSPSIKDGYQLDKNGYKVSLDHFLQMLRGAEFKKFVSEARQILEFTLLANQKSAKAASQQKLLREKKLSPNRALPALVPNAPVKKTLPRSEDATLAKRAKLHKAKKTISFDSPHTIGFKGGDNAAKPSASSGLEKSKRKKRRTPPELSDSNDSSSSITATDDLEVGEDFFVDETF
jgi:hypothetical protein